MLKVALYARVSTRDKGQNPETQLRLLREHAARQNWETVGEFVDQASAKDMRSRTAWARLMEIVDRRQLDAVLVTRLDRAFRSSADTYDYLRRLEAAKVGFVAMQQPEVNTTTSAGRLLLAMAAAFASFEREVIVERVHEGLARARAQGKRLGRPPGARDSNPRRRAGYNLRWAGGKANNPQGRPAPPALG